MAVQDAKEDALLPSRGSAAVATLTIDRPARKNAIDPCHVA